MNNLKNLIRGAPGYIEGLGSHLNSVMYIWVTPQKTEYLVRALDSVKELGSNKTRLYERPTQDMRGCLSSFLEWSKGRIFRTNQLSNSDECNNQKSVSLRGQLELSEVPVLLINRAPLVIQKDCTLTKVRSFLFNLAIGKLDMLLLHWSELKK